MDSKELTRQLQEFDKRRAEQARKILVQMAQQIAKADALSDEEMRTLDATLRNAGVTRQQVGQMIQTLIGHKVMVNAFNQADEAKHKAAVQVAEANLKQVMAERSEVPLMCNEARERWWQRRDNAKEAVAAAKHELQRFIVTKESLAKVEKDNAELLAIGGR